MLSDLRGRVEEHIGQPVEAAMPAFPHLVALYTEDVKDAFENARTRFISIPGIERRYIDSVETRAAYAGYGYGLCSDYTNETACRREMMNFKDDHVMAVLYTWTALTVSLSILKGVTLWEPPYRHVEDFSLGYDARYEHFDQGDYWYWVRMELEQIMRDNSDFERPQKVLLMGDCAVEDPTFKRVLTEALLNQGAEAAEIRSEGTEDVAAQGAAELAKRFLYYES